MHLIKKRPEPTLADLDALVLRDAVAFRKWGWRLVDLVLISAAVVALGLWHIARIYP